jgi:hypothetical protein
MFSKYYYRYTWPSGSKSGSGSTLNGQTFTNNITIGHTALGSILKLEYGYNTTNGVEFNYSRSYFINIQPSSMTWANNKDATYGLGIFERVFIVTCIILLIAGTASYFAGSLVGGLFGLLIFFFFSLTGFIEWYIALPTAVIGFIIIVSGSKQ